jgi:hypothetical protein
MIVEPISPRKRKSQPSQTVALRWWVVVTTFKPLEKFCCVNISRCVGSNSYRTVIGHPRLLRKKKDRIATGRGSSRLSWIGQIRRILYLSIFSYIQISLIFTLILTLKTSVSGSPGLISRPRDRLCPLRYFMVFFRTLNHMPG